MYQYLLLEVIKLSKNEQIETAVNEFFGKLYTLIVEETTPTDNPMWKEFLKENPDLIYADILTHGLMNEIVHMTMMKWSMYVHGMMLKHLK